MMQLHHRIHASVCGRAKPGAGLSRNTRAARPCSTPAAAGLYGLGLKSPDDWSDVVSEVRRTCIDVASSGCDNTSDADAAGQHQSRMLINVINYARLPALHASQHHPDATWRQAAQAASEDLTHLGTFLTDGPCTPGLAQQIHGSRAPHMLSAQNHTGEPSSATPCSVSTPSSRQLAGTTAPSATAATPLDLPLDHQIQLAQAVEQQLRAALEQLLARAPTPWLILHAAEVEDDAGLAPYLQPVPAALAGNSCTASIAPVSSAPAGSSQKVPSMAQVRAAVLRWYRRSGQQAGRATRVRRKQILQCGRPCHHHRALRVQTYLMRCLSNRMAHTQRVRNKPQVRQRAALVPAGVPTKYDLATLRHTSLPLQLWARTRTVKATSIDFGPSAFATRAAAGTVLSWRRACTVGESAAGGTSSGLVGLPLDAAFALQMLRQHPQRAIRRAVYHAAILPRVHTILQAAEMLAVVRQQIAQSQGATSYSHLQLASSSPGGPRPVSIFLKELAQALDGLVAEQLGAGAALMERAGQLQGTRLKLQPWDVEAASSRFAEARAQGMPKAGVRAAGGGLIPVDWSNTAPHFSLQGLLSAGLSRVLRAAGLQVHLAPMSPGELWATAGPDGPQPIKLLLLDLQQQKPGNRQVAAVVYVVPDASTSQPFTTLVRPGIKSCEAEASCPAVAVHLPTGLLVCAPLRSVIGGTDTLTLLRSPSLLRTILHEMGHVLSYALSARDAAAEQDPFGCVCFATTDVRELPSHLMERCVYDEATLMALSTSPAAAAAMVAALAAGAGDPTVDSTVGDVLPGAATRSGGVADVQPSITAQVAHSLAAQLSANCRESALDLQQHALAALCDVALHAQPPSQRMRLSGHQGERRVVGLMRTAWRRNSTFGRLVLTQHVLAVLPGMLLNPAGMHAYPTATLLSAALSSKHGLTEGPHGWGAVRMLLHVPGHMHLHEVAHVLLADDSCMPVGDGDDAGFIPDLAHPVFQCLEL